MPYQIIFNILIIYYWVIIFAFGFVEVVEKYSVIYFLYILPIIMFLALCLPKIIILTTESIIPLWIFLFLVCLVSIIRLDFQTIITVALMVLTIIAVINYRLQVNLKLLNTLYLLSIFLTIILYHLYIVNYGYIPGQTKHLSETWRVSMMPLLADSGLFSLLIFIINYYFNKNKYTRTFFLILSFYFLVFTGIRSMLILFMIFILFVFVSKRIQLKNRPFYQLYNWIIIVGLILFLFFNSFLIIVMHKIDIPIINKILFKTEHATITQKELGKTIFRTWIWEQHFKMFKRNPLMGIGTFDFATEVVYPPDAPRGMTGSESPLTGLLARVGIVTIFFILFFQKLWKNGLIFNDKYKYFLPMLILISLLTYGSYFNPYNFFFLVLFASYNGVYVKKIEVNPIS